MRWIIIIAMVAGALTPASAQYQELRKEGLSFREQGKFSESINRFLGALVSPDKPRSNDLAEQIRQSQDAWLRQLERAENSRKAAELSSLRAQVQSRALALAFQVKSRLADDPDPTHTLRLAEEAYRLNPSNLIVMQSLMEMAAVHQARGFSYYQDLNTDAIRLKNMQVLSARGDSLAECFTYDPMEFNVLEEPIMVKSGQEEESLQFWPPQTGFCGSPYGFDVINEAALRGAEGDTLALLRQYGGISALAFLPDAQLLTLSDFEELTYGDGAPVGDGQARLWSTEPREPWEVNDTTVRAPDTGVIYRLRPSGEDLLSEERYELLAEEGEVVLTFEKDKMDFDGYQLSLDPGDYFAGRVTLRDREGARVATLDGAKGLFSNDGRYVLTWRYGAELWLTPYGIYSWIRQGPFHRLTREEQRRYRF